MFERERDLSDFFTELGQALPPQEQQRVFKILLDCVDYKTCRIMPGVLSLDGVGEAQLNFDIPFSVEDLGRGHLHVFGEAYSVDICALKDVEDAHWRGLDHKMKPHDVRDHFRFWNRLKPDDMVSVVHVDPKSFFVGRVVPDGIVEVVPTLPLKMH